MGQKRKIEEKRFCKKCGNKLSSLNTGSVCFRHNTQPAELSVGWPIRGASSGPSGLDVRYTQRIEYGRYVE